MNKITYSRIGENWWGLLETVIREALSAKVAFELRPTVGQCKGLETVDKTFVPRA